MYLRSEIVQNYDKPAVEYQTPDLHPRSREYKSRLRKLHYGIGLAAVAGALIAGSSGSAQNTSPEVMAYPSSTTINQSGHLTGGGPEVTLNVARREKEGAWIVARNAEVVSETIDNGNLGPIKLKVDFGHYVKFGSSEVPDALTPWDGSERSTEKNNQAMYVQADIPPGVPAGKYHAEVKVNTDGVETDVPVNIKVFNVTLPPPNQAPGNVLTSFNISPQAYVNKADALYNLGTNQARSAANKSLFDFLSEYRISPASWGFGEPKKPIGDQNPGYASSGKWWLDSAGNMIKENELGFSAMRIPISNNRTSNGNYVGTINPNIPESWCSYLKGVHTFWQQNGWLNNRLPYLYTSDEPGPKNQELVVRQSAAIHQRTNGETCFDGARILITGNPTENNKALWDNASGDDVDIWAVLSRRYYGEFKSNGVDRSTQNLADINKVRKAGKMIWSYTYSGVAGTPGFSASEPLSDSRMFMLWNGFENIQGTLYAQGMSTYGPGDPFKDVVPQHGESVLIYPGQDEPIASARLEQIRDGLEDDALFNIVRSKAGSAAVRKLLEKAGLFSEQLACNFGCELKSNTKYSWPEWSQTTSTPKQIEAAKLAALKIASGS